MSLLELRSVVKAYPRGHGRVLALRDVTLDVPAGSLVSVYGARDTGKTTLLRVAAGFDRPDSGNVTIRGRALAGLSRRQLLRLRRETVGWVEREGPHDRHLTMASYVALPLYRELGRRGALRQGIETLKAFDAGEYGDERWDDLSEAARTLCAIAQAVVRRPRLLIADDPTAGLGMIDRQRICDILRGAAEDEGLGVLIAVPDMPAMLRSHHSLALSRGRLLGPTERPGADPPHGNVIRLDDRRSA